MCAYEPILGGVGTAGPGQVIEDFREPIAFAKLIESEGLDFISVSGGTVGGNYEVIMPTKVYPEGVFRHFSWTKTIKEAVSIPVIGAGYSYLRDGKNDITESDPNKKSALYWAEKNVNDGNVDLVGFGRQFMADPFFARKALSGDLDAISYCTACMSCGALLGNQQRVGCAVYDDDYRKLFAQIKDE
jgi:2,4-dienoyl-CoA reductase-like NADH-dependent reductase (Old Yellow Enzyme family)